MLEKTLEFCLDILFPKQCVNCRREGSFLCERCGKIIQPAAFICFVCERRSPEGIVCKSCRPRTHLSRFFAPLRYEEPVVRELMHTFKYGGAKEIGAILASFINESLETVSVAPPDNAFFVPIPLHRVRLRERGFNQADIIASAVAERYRLPITQDILKRVKAKPPQTTLKRREERETNAKGIYQSAPLGGWKTIILVDDVSTTGATFEEAAKVLKAAGAREVWAVAAAR